MFESIFRPLTRPFRSKSNSYNSSSSKSSSPKRVRNKLRKCSTTSTTSATSLSTLPSRKTSTATSTPVTPTGTTIPDYATRIDSRDFSQHPTNHSHRASTTSTTTAKGARVSFELDDKGIPIQVGQSTRRKVNELVGDKEREMRRSVEWEGAPERRDSEAVHYVQFGM